MGSYVTATFGLEEDLHRTFSVFGIRSTVADGAILPVWFIRMWRLRYSTQSTPRTFSCHGCPVCLE